VGNRVWSIRICWGDEVFAELKLTRWRPIGDAGWKQNAERKALLFEKDESLVGAGLSIAVSTAVFLRDDSCRK
jgi:hypothetical protein